MDSIAEFRRRQGKLLVLTGAGISAESGVPTFRGQEGYWKVGSQDYHPMEMATHQAFAAMPEEVWAWYLYRRAVCLNAAPNAGHRAIASMEAHLQDRFLLVTQNVDGLHLRGGSSEERTFQIHGNIHYMRCDDGSPELTPIPEYFGADWAKGRALSAVERDTLSCPACPGLARPHVLWFDESYDAPLFRFESSLRAASERDLLLVIGTTGSTNLPLQIGEMFARRGCPIIVINPEPNPFTEFAASCAGGLFLEGTAGEHLPRLLGRLID